MIITGTGEYRTRDGSLAIVHTIIERGPNKGKGFGSIWSKTYHGGRRAQCDCVVWDRNGRLSPATGFDAWSDIVDRWGEVWAYRTRTSP